MDFVPCSDVELLMPGETYVIYLYFSLTASRTEQVNVFSLGVDIADPVGGSITPDSLKFFTVSNGNAGQPIYPGFTIPSKTRMDAVAYTYFKFSPDINTSILPGQFTFTISASGNRVSNATNLVTPFSESTDTYFQVNYVDTDEECPNDPLSQATDPENSHHRIFESSIESSWQPNPTQNAAILKLDLAQESRVDVAVLNMQGQVVLSPFRGEILSQGVHRKKLEVSDLPAGIYYTRITSDTGTKVIKWVKLE